MLASRAASTAYSSRRADRDRERRRRPRDPRPSHLARPRQPPLHARRPDRPGARLGSRGRDVERARVGVRLGRCRLVPARRPRHRPPPRPHGGTARRRAALGRSPRCSASARGSPRASSRRRTTAFARTSRRRPGGSRSRSGSSADAMPTRSTRSRYEGAAAREPASGVPSTRSPTRTRSCSRRATRTSRSDRSSPIDAIRDAIERRTVRCVAVSPLVGGEAVTGPLARMLTRMAGGATPAHVAARYDGPDRRARDRRADAPADADVELVVASTRDDRPRR